MPLLASNDTSNVTMPDIDSPHYLRFNEFLFVPFGCALTEPVLRCDDFFARRAGFSELGKR